MRTAACPKLAAAALAAALLLCSGTVLAQNLSLQNLVVDNQAGSLAARFGVTVDGVAELSDMLAQGLSLTLTCKGRLSKPGGFFGGTQVFEARMDSRLKLDALTKEYVLSVPGRETPLRGPRLDELLRAGWGALTLDMGPWHSLARGKEYTLSLDIRLSQTDIPGWFKRTLFFWSWDAAPQLSYQLTFKY